MPKTRRSFKKYYCKSCKKLIYNRQSHAKYCKDCSQKITEITKEIQVFVNNKLRTESYSDFKIRIKVEVERAKENIRKSDSIN